MKSAIIGHTGFVGGNLVRQRRFDDLYRSTNIDQIAAKSYNLIVCSGAPAEKWKANQNPEADRRCLDRLWAGLGAAEAERVVLISTVDVYARPIDVDEDSDVDHERATPYGRRRYELEERVTSRFNALVVRLPALFGEGLKKNVVFDMLHGNDLDKIDARAIYQFYAINNLWNDIKIALQNGTRTLNIATEPTSVREISQEGFGLAFDNELQCEPVRYDFRSKYDRLFGGAGGYLYSKRQILHELRSFVEARRNEMRCA